MAILWQYGFESETLTTAAFDAITGSVSKVTSPVAFGRYALMCDAQGANAYLTKNITGTMFVFQFRFFLPSSVSDGYDMRAGASITGPGNVTQFRILTGTPTSTLRLRQTDGVATVDVDASISRSNWYHVTGRLDVSTNPRTCEWRLDGVAQTTNSLAAVATTLSVCDLGNLDGASTIVGYYDDWVGADASSDYPININVPETGGVLQPATQIGYGR